MGIIGAGELNRWVVKKATARDVEAVKRAGALVDDIMSEVRYPCVCRLLRRGIAVPPSPVCCSAACAI